MPWLEGAHQTKIGKLKLPKTRYNAVDILEHELAAASSRRALRVEKLQRKSGWLHMISSIRNWASRPQMVGTPCKFSDMAMLLPSHQTRQRSELHVEVQAVLVYQSVLDLETRITASQRLCTGSRANCKWFDGSRHSLVMKAAVPCIRTETTILRYKNECCYSLGSEYNGTTLPISSEPHVRRGAPCPRMVGTGPSPSAFEDKGRRGKQTCRWHAGGEQQGTQQMA